MNIVLISTSDTRGGAAIAASRTMNALRHNGCEAKMLVREKLSDNENVISLSSTLDTKRNFYWERGCIFLNNCFSRQNLFDVSIANTGVSIVDTPQFRQADIIHLHWINQGMLSLNEIGKILASRKKVIWTMHDMWAFTGICHHAGTCKNYETGCGNCPYLVSASKNDLSNAIFRKKQQTYSKGKITFVACSHWLKDLAEKSPLTNGHTVVSIANPIDTQMYFPKDKNTARKQFGLHTDKKIVLFAAVKASDKRKGTDFLIEAGKRMKDENILFLIAGANGEEIARQLSAPTINAGYVSPEKMSDLYNAADVFVTPSLQENLPNTIMEAMACGTPCVGFHIGGIPEMIDHRKTGYVAAYKDAGDLANGILWTLTSGTSQTLCTNAREKVLQEYAQEKIAKQYIDIYHA